MLSIKEAITIAAKYVEEQGGASDINMVLIEEPIFESEVCWVFGYNSEEHLRTKSLGSALAGNAPILIDKRSGAQVITGTAHPIQYYVDRYTSSKKFS